MARRGRPDPRKQLERELRLFLWTEEQARRVGAVYRGPADFVLQHGEWFEPRQLPDGVKRGLLGQCYSNAIICAVIDGCEYVEGYALTELMLYQHAWNVDADGGLVDSTWTGKVGEIYGIPAVGAPALAYLGVRFSVERADDACWNGNASVLDDWERRWPLLRERWQGETADAAGRYPVGPNLLALRAWRDGDRETALRMGEEMRAEVEEAEQRGFAYPARPPWERVDARTRTETGGADRPPDSYSGGRRRAYNASDGVGTGGGG